MGFPLSIVLLATPPITMTPSFDPELVSDLLPFPPPSANACPPACADGGLGKGDRLRSVPFSLAVLNPDKTTPLKVWSPPPFPSLFETNVLPSFPYSVFFFCPPPPTSRAVTSRTRSEIAQSLPAQSTQVSCGSPVRRHPPPWPRFSLSLRARQHLPQKNVEKIGFHDFFIHGVIFFSIFTLPHTRVMCRARHIE